MPLYVGTSQKRRRVKLLTAGDTVYKLTNELGGTVDLKAIVNDETNLRNHTLTWEQTKGSEVQLSSENTLESSYEITDNTDKSFEFYIDKGLNTQQTKKVDIYYTPTSTTSAEKGYASKRNDNFKTIPNFRFELGSEYPEPTGESDYDVRTKTGTGIVFDDVSEPFLAGNAIRLRLYGEVGVWTHNPTTLIKTVDAVDGKVAGFTFVENGSYAVEIDYFSNNVSGEVTYRSEPIFAFYAETSEDPIRGIDEAIRGSVGHVFKVNSVAREKYTPYPIDYVLNQKSGFVFKNTYIDRAVHTKIDNLVTSINRSYGTYFKLTKVTRLDPSQVGSS